MESPQLQFFDRGRCTRAALGHGFGVPVVCNDGVARRFGVVDVSSRSSHLEIWYIFLHDFVSGSHIWCLGVVFGMLSIGFFGR